MASAGAAPLPTTAMGGNGTTLPDHGMIPPVVEMTVFLLASVPALFFIVAGPVRLCQIKKALATQPINTLAHCKLGLRYAKQDELDVSFARYYAKIIVSISASCAYGIRLALLFFYLISSSALVPTESMWYHVLDCGSNIIAWILSAFVVYFEFHCLQKQNWLQLGFWWTATFLNIVAVVSSAIDIDTSREGTFLIGDLASRFFLLVPLTVMAILALFPRDIDKETIDRMRQIVQSVVEAELLAAEHGAGDGGPGTDDARGSHHRDPRPFGGAGGDTDDYDYNAMENVVGGPSSDTGGLAGLSTGRTLSSADEDVDRKRLQALITTTSHRPSTSGHRDKGDLGSLLSEFEADDDDGNDSAPRRAPSQRRTGPGRAGGGSGGGSGSGGDVGGDDGNSHWTVATRSTNDATSDVIEQMARLRREGSMQRFATTSQAMNIPTGARAPLTGRRVSAGGLGNPRIRGSSSLDERGLHGGFRGNRPHAASTSFTDERSRVRMGSSVGSNEPFLRSHRRNLSGSSDRGDGFPSMNRGVSRSIGGSYDGRRGMHVGSVGSTGSTGRSWKDRGPVRPSGLYGSTTTGEQQRWATNRRKAASVAGSGSTYMRSPRVSLSNSAAASPRAPATSEAGHSSSDDNDEMLLYGGNSSRATSAKSRTPSINQASAAQTSVRAERTPRNSRLQRGGWGEDTPNKSSPPGATDVRHLSSRLPTAQCAQLDVSEFDIRGSGRSKNDRYIVFKVIITNAETKASWVIWKRYSDFREFDKQLRAYLKQRDAAQLKLLPSLPPKNRAVKASMDVRPNSKGAELLRARMEGLREYVRNVHYDLLAQPLEIDKSKHSLQGVRPFLDLEAASRGRF